MSRIRSKDTRPEKLVRTFLFGKGYRYSLHSNLLPGKPDIVLKKYKTVILVNGCFWHQHKNCQRSVTPKSNQQYWIKKINQNVARDKRNIRALKLLGWKVIVIWECNLKGSVAAGTLARLEKRIESS